MWYLGNLSPDEACFAFSLTKQTALTLITDQLPNGWCCKKLWGTWGETAQILKTTIISQTIIIFSMHIWVHSCHKYKQSGSLGQRWTLAWTIDSLTDSLTLQFTSQSTKQLRNRANIHLHGQIYNCMLTQTQTHKTENDYYNYYFYCLALF